MLSPDILPALRPEMAQPSGVKIETGDQRARLIQRWFSLKFIPLAFFAVVWDGFLIFWYSAALAAGAPWIMVVFPMAHVAVGVGLTYYVIAGFFNRTILEVSPETVIVRFEPLPWIGKKNLKTRELKQFFCKEKTSRTKNGIRIQYQLHVVTAANKQMKLMGGLDDADTAVFMEQQMERWLKIEDRPVTGEIAR